MVVSARVGLNTQRTSATASVVTHDEFETRRGLGACHEPATMRHSILEALKNGRVSAVNLVLRLDWGFRALAAAYFSVFALVVLIFTIVAALHAIVVAIVPLAMFLLVAAWGWRWRRLEVIGNDTDLIVRNVLATRRIPRRSIRDFRIGGAAREYPGRAIRAVLEDGSTIVLSATGRYTEGEEGHDARLALPLDWLHANPATDGVGRVRSVGR